MKHYQINILNPTHRRTLYNKYGSWILKSSMLTHNAYLKIAIMNQLHQDDTFFNNF